MKLNNLIEKYKLYFGCIAEQMPILLSEGRFPLGAAGLMRLKLEVLESGDKGLIASFWNSYFDTDTGIAYHPSGAFKVVPRAEFLRKITRDTPLSEGAVKLGNDVVTSIDNYNSLEGFQVDRETTVLGRRLTKQEAENHPVWIALVEEDTKLLKDYVAAVWKRTGCETNMGFWVAEPQKVATGRSVYINCDDFSDSYGDDDVDYINGCLIGVVHELQEVKASQSDAIKQAVVISNLEDILSVVEPFIRGVESKKQLKEKLVKFFTTNKKFLINSIR